MLGAWSEHAANPDSLTKKYEGLSGSQLGLKSQGRRRAGEKYRRLDQSQFNSRISAQKPCSIIVLVKPAWVEQAFLQQKCAARFCIALTVILSQQKRLRRGVRRSTCYRYPLRRAIRYRAAPNALEALRNKSLTPKQNFRHQVLPNSVLDSILDFEEDAINDALQVTVEFMG